MKEKIKSMILSQDVETKLLGLALLGEEKDSSELFLIPTGFYTDWVVTETLPGDRTFVSFYELYKILQQDRPIYTTNLRLIEPYIEYCCDKKGI